MHREIKITATVCVYSGRPDPHWTISDMEYSELLLHISSLPVTNTQERAGILGYSGIEVVAGKKHLYVFNEVITITDGDLVYAHADKNRYIEKQLIKSAPLSIQKEINGLLPEMLK